MNIAGIEVGLGNPPIIVAEVGAAHNGSLDTAKELIAQAKKAGADLVKIQCFLPETITADYQRPEFIIQEGPWKGQRMIELYRQAHMPRAWFPQLFAHAHVLDIPLFASVFSVEDVEFIEQFSPPAYKISSFELVDTLLIRCAASKGKPMILSTGMTSWGEINGVARAVSNLHYNAIWLHCVSAYPTRVEDAELGMINILRRQFDNVGFSDHTMGSEAAMMAVALRACMIEKHITMTPGGDGLDDHFAIGPGDFARFCSDVKKAWQGLGNPANGPSHATNGADRHHAPLRRSLYVCEPIKEGQMFTTANVRSIRPGLGLPPRYFSDIMGQRATMDIPEGTPLATHHVKDWVVRA